MKLFAIIFLASATCGQMFGQTMKWIPSGTATGNCQDISDDHQSIICYSLEYTPDVSGVLTSYTTGFYATCTSAGVSVISNESCSMHSHTKIADVCSDLGKTLFISSGTGGSPERNKIEAKKPVILHQVCFSIPPGESVILTEEENIDLITSIDESNGNHGVEYPIFATASVQGKIITPVSTDFKVSLTPNPARQFINVEISNAGEEALINILDNNGRIVRSDKSATGTSTKRLNTGDLSAGMYTLNVTSGDKYHTEKFVVIK